MKCCSKCSIILKVQGIAVIQLNTSFYSPLTSYQYKVHCKIAEYYLQQLSQEENSTGKDYALPDLVTVAEEANAERKKRVRQQMSKCLRMFHATSIKDLERESRYTKQGNVKHSQQSCFTKIMFGFTATVL